MKMVKNIQKKIQKRKKIIAVVGVLFIISVVAMSFMSTASILNTEAVVIFEPTSNSPEGVYGCYEGDTLEYDISFRPQDTGLADPDCTFYRIYFIDNENVETLIIDNNMQQMIVPLSSYNRFDVDSSTTVPRPSNDWTLYIRGEMVVNGETYYNEFELYVEWVWDDETTDTTVPVTTEETKEASGFGILSFFVVMGVVCLKKKRSNNNVKVK